MRYGIRDNVEILVMRFLRLEQRSHEESSEVVEMREVSLSRGIADDVESVVAVRKVGWSLCPGTPSFLAILIVEVAAADHGEAHLAGANGRVDNSLLVGPAQNVKGGTN